MIPYYLGDVVFPSSVDTEPSFDLFCTSFKNFDFRSQILGGHGTGKTTFLIEFVQFLERQGYIVNHFTLHDGQRTLTNEFLERHISLVSQYKIEMVKKPPIAVIDGYEQLSLAQKIRLRLSCRKGKSGLLITTHSPAWRLPVLLRTETTLDTLQHIIGYVFRSLPHIEPPDKALCQSLFHQHQGNLRSVLFDLYDLYEELHFSSSRNRVEQSFQGDE